MTKMSYLPGGSPEDRGTPPWGGGGGGVSIEAPPLLVRRREVCETEQRYERVYGGYRGAMNNRGGRQGQSVRHCQKKNRRGCRKTDAKLRAMQQTDRCKMRVGWEGMGWPQVK
jgi:hypothetical protein